MVVKEVLLRILIYRQPGMHGICYTTKQKTCHALIQVAIAISYIAHNFSALHIVGS